MKKRITEYRKRVDRLLADEEEKTYEEWECILEEHLVQIGFFQHERLIHLMSRTMKISVQKEIMTYLKSQPQLSYKIN